MPKMRTRIVITNNQSDGAISGLMGQLFLILGPALCFCVAIFTGTSPPADGYELLFMLPLTNGLFMIFFRRVFYNPFQRIGTLIMNVITFIRFTVTPFLMSLTGEIMSEGTVPPTEDSRREAIWIMIYEMVVVYVIMYLLTRKFNLDRRRVIFPEHRQLYDDGNENTLIVITLILFAAMEVVLPSIFTEFTFFSRLIRFLNIQQLYAGYMITTAAKTVIVGAIIYNCYRKYAITGKSTYMYISLFVLLFSIGFMTINVRNFLLITAAAAIIVMFYLYKDNAGFLLYAVAGFFVVLIIGVTLFTMTTRTRNVDGTLIDSILGETMSELEVTLQAYFSGVTNIASSLDMCNSFIYVDRGDVIVQETAMSLFPWSLIANRFVTIDESYRIDYLFNYQCKDWFGSTSMICPMVGQGVFMFGKLLSPLFSVICVLLLVWVEKMRFEQKNFRYFYVLTVISVIMGVTHMYSFSIMMRYISNLLLVIFGFIFAANVVRKLFSRRQAYSRKRERTERLYYGKESE